MIDRSSASSVRLSGWWRDDFTMRFAIINGLPGVIVDAPEGSYRRRWIEGGVIQAIYLEFDLLVPRRKI